MDQKDTDLLNDLFNDNEQPKTGTFSAQWNALFGDKENQIKRTPSEENDEFSSFISARSTTASGSNNAMPANSDFLSSLTSSSQSGKQSLLPSSLFDLDQSISASQSAASGTGS